MAKLKPVTNEMWETINGETRDLIEDYLSSLTNLSPQTKIQYTSALHQFAWWIKQTIGLGKDEKCVTEIKKRDALKFQNFLIEHMSSSAIKFKKSACSSFYTYLENFYDEEYPLLRNPFMKLPLVANVKVKEKNPLTSREINTLIAELTNRQDWQKLAYLLFSYISGCRREESRQLLKEVVTYNKHKDRDGNKKNFYVTHPIRAKGRGKLGKVRTFAFDDRAMETVKKWIQVRGNDDCPYVFVSKTKDGYKQVSSNTFNLWCKDFSEIIGKKVHPHILRSFRATIEIVENGKDIKAVQALLGHQSSTTTEIYVIRDDSNDIDDLF
jgi:site-specific recombinase XerD